MLGGSHAGGGVAVVGCVAEVLDLGVADFGFGVYEEDLAGDLVVLFPRQVSMIEWGLIG